jgi:hypothetical protein
VGFTLTLSPKRGCDKYGLEDMPFHGSSKNDGLKKVKLEFPEHDVLEVEKIQDDLESCILKACCDKVMPTQLKRLLFRRASNVRAFEKHLVLLNLFMDFVSNILFVHRNGGKGNGKQYHPSTIKLFEFLQNFGGSSVHNFMSKNLVGLALNTTRSNFCKEGLVYSISINEFTFCYMCLIMKKCKGKLGLSMLIPLNVEKMKQNALNLPHGIGG